MVVQSRINSQSLCPSSSRWGEVAAPATAAPATAAPATAALAATAQLLVVDGDHATRETIARAIQVGGDRTLAVDSGESALAILNGAVFDLVIMDVELSGLSGLETLRRIRERSDTPVMIVSAAGTLAERVASFDFGADDYMVKPLDVADLCGRVRAILRRSQGAARAADRLLGPAGLILRHRAHTVHVGSEQVALTPKQFAVLRLLLEHRGEVISSDELSVRIWGYETFGSRNFVEAQISRLRSKLAAAGAEGVLTNFRGVGYVIS